MTERQHVCKYFILTQSVSHYKTYDNNFISSVHTCKQIDSECCYENVALRKILKINTVSMIFRNKY